MKKLFLILLLILSVNGFSQFIINSYSFGAAAFSPSNIAGLRLWVQADAITGLVNDDPVSTWSDLSGNSNDFTMTSTQRPLYKTNILNGKPVLRFDGTDDFMEKASPTGLDGGTGMTIFMVVKHPGAATTRIYLAKWDYQTQGSWAWQTLSTDEVVFYVASSLTEAGTNTKSTSTSDMTNSWYLLTMVYDGTQATSADRVKFYKNTTLPTQSSAGTLGTSLVSSTATLKLGKFGGSLTRYFSGDFGEILIYDSALSDVNRASVAEYLNTRWALY